MFSQAMKNGGFSKELFGEYQLRSSGEYWIFRISFAYDPIAALSGMDYRAEVIQTEEKLSYDKAVDALLTRGWQVSEEERHLLMLYRKHYK